MWFSILIEFSKGKVFPWNTNNKLGELGGASKGFLCCDFKPNRPFRVVTGSEDYGVYYYKGPPFKFETYDKTHKNYVNDIRFTPDGSSYLSVSSDKKILEFDGKTGKLKREICDGKGKNNTHKGSIYCLCFNKDGTKFITSSADKTCKIWNYESGQVEFTYKFSDKPTVFDMQVSCIWLENYIVSLSLNGKLNYLDSDFKQEEPVKVLTGHRKGINDMDIDYKNNYLYTVDGDSRIVRTECKSGECEDIFGTEILKKAILKFVRVTCSGNNYYTVASDDTFCLSSTSTNKFGNKLVKIDGSARALIVGRVNENLCIIPTHRNKFQVINGEDIKKTVDLDFTPLCGDISFDDKFIALGGSDKNVHIYSVDDCKQIDCIKSPNFLRYEVICVAISPNNEYIATADKNKNIWIWDYKNKKFDEPLNKTQGFKFHGGLISSLEFSQNKPYKLVSAAFDSTLYVWTKPCEGKNDYIKLEPKENVITFIGAIKKVKFLNENRLVGIGADTTIRFLNILGK